MGKIAHITLEWLAAFGFEPVKTWRALKNLPTVIGEYRALKVQNKGALESWTIDFSKPCLHDRVDQGGTASGHYFHQDLLVARKIYERNPQKHVDVGSQVDGFVAHVAIFREIEVLDVRPTVSQVPNVTFRQVDLMNPGSEFTNYCDSLSCLHALEHFGLGRYGDPLDVDGYKKGFDWLTAMLKPDGVLYISFPIGEDRLEFNGQRVFSVRRAERLLRDHFTVISFNYVDDSGALVEGPIDLSLGFNDDFGVSHGCGIFELRRVSQ